MTCKPSTTIKAVHRLQAENTNTLYSKYFVVLLPGEGWVGRSVQGNSESLSALSRKINSVRSLEGLEVKSKLRNCQTADEAVVVLTNLGGDYIFTVCE